MDLTSRLKASTKPGGIEVALAQAGEHEFRVSVRDSEGREGKTEFKLTVKQGRLPMRCPMVARAVTPDNEGNLGIEKAAKQVDKRMKAAALAAAATASLYAGILSLLE